MALLRIFPNWSHILFCGSLAVIFFYMKRRLQVTSWLGSIFDKKNKMWDKLTTFWSLDRAKKHYSLKEQPLNMPLGRQNPYAKRAHSFNSHAGDIFGREEIT